MVRKSILEIKHEFLRKKYNERKAAERKEKARLNLKQKKRPKIKDKRFNTDHLRGKSYSVFLASEYWSLVRKMVLKRDKNKCRVCNKTYLLQVHHETYINHFYEHLHLEDLITLCNTCHKEHHYAQM